MNRSIAKTRNQLERITLKINQLKTKYTTDNITPHLHNGENSPTHSRYREKEFLSKDPLSHQIKYSQPMQITRNSTPATDDLYQKEFKIFRNEIYNYIDKCLLLTKEREEQIMQRALLELTEGSRMRKSKFSLEERIKKIEEETTNCIGTIQDTILQTKKNEKYFGDKISHTQAKIKKEVKQLEQKLQKDREQRVDEVEAKLIAAEKAILILKEQLSKQDQKYTTINELLTQKQAKEEGAINKINSRVSDVKDEMEQLTISKFSYVQGQMEKYNLFNINLQKQLIGLKEELQLKTHQLEQTRIKNHTANEQKMISNVKELINSKAQETMDALQQQIESMKEMILNETGRIVRSFESKVDNQNEASANEQMERINSLQGAVSKNCTDIASIAETVLDLEEKIQQMEANSYHREDTEDKAERETDIQQIRSQLEQRIQQIMHSLAGIRTSISSTQIQTEQISLKMGSLPSAAQRSREQLVQSIGHQLSVEMEANIEEVKNKIEEIRVELQGRISATLNRNLDDRSEKMMKKVNEITLDSHYNLEACIKQISNIKQAVFAELAKMQAKLEQQYPPRNLVRIETVDTLIDQNSICNEKREKTSPHSELIEQDILAVQLPKQELHQESPNKKTIEFVEEKLNQFQNDINETIKLLYEDIENKVNDMLGHTGMMDFRADYEHTKQSISDMQIKLKQLVNDLSQRPQNSGTLSEAEGKNTHQQIEQLRVQVYNQIGNKVEQLSSILERTVEEMEIKVEKLDGNFSYMYERLSNIEYDNASFKDKLTELLAFRAQRERSNQKKLETKATDSKGENMLDVLGQFNLGSSTFEMDKFL